MTSQPQRVAEFRALHAPGQILVLPNAWDAASARAGEEAGAKAIATSSAAVAWCHGYADGEAIPHDTLMASIREIVRVVRVPVSVDSEAGYSRDPAEVAAYTASLREMGVAGINLEDGTDPAELLAAKIKVIKGAGGDIFVNARADVYLKNLVPDGAKLAEMKRRAALYRDAGADGLFVPGIADLSIISEIVRAIDLPVNCLAQKTSPPVAELKAAGVRRVSAGAGISRAAYGAAMRATKMMLDEGKYDAIFVSAADCPEFNKYFG
jgi:2-methylisocitrate lyase-like PEP mutase family enzyme